MDKKCIFVILIAITLVLSACFSPWKGDEGAFSIRIGSDTDGRAASWLNKDIIPRLEHTITLNYGLGLEQTQKNVKYGETVNFSVMPGRWTITITAYLDGEIYAEGSRVVDIKPGPNGAIAIKMELLKPVEPPAPPEPPVPPEPVTFTVTFKVFDNVLNTYIAIKTYENVPYGSTIQGFTPAFLDGFIGWYTDPEAGKEWDFENDTVTGNIILYARLSAAMEIPNYPTPAAEDFIVSGLSHIYDGNPKTVHITPHPGKSDGAITVYYDGETTAPAAIGSYEITFDIAASEGWNAAEGLSAGTMEIAQQVDNPETPVIDDFIIDNLTQTVGSVTDVTIEPREGKSEGLIIIYYNGSIVLPTAVGSYRVTFDIEAALGWNAANGLLAGILTIKPQQGDANITINLWLNEEDGTIQQGGNNVTDPIIISGKQTFTVNWGDNTINETASWYVGGSQIDTGPTITIDPKNYNKGTYQLMVMVYKNGKPYSKEISFEVVE
jgi:hypothetical protein